MARPGKKEKEEMEKKKGTGMEKCAKRMKELRGWKEGGGNAGSWVGIGAVRDFEEGNISIDVRFIDLPAARPYEMAGARVTCHFVK